jgi:hypothetical protein
MEGLVINNSVVRGAGTPNYSNATKEQSAIIFITTSNDYRRIYESYHGPIPKDNDGRSYEIHHIDGDRTNNSIENLKLVTIQEHYDIHFSQGDWGACWKIAERMAVSPEERSKIQSELAIKNNKERVENGTHNFLDKEQARQRAVKRVASGTHNFLNKEHAKKRQAKRISQSTHNFVGENNPSIKKAKEWIVTDPQGTSQSITNLAKFCRENKLDDAAMIGVAKGRYTHHHGWKCNYKE